MADPRYKNLELKVGFFILFAIVSITTLVVTVGIDKGIFTAKISVYVYSNTGEGINQGMPVNYAGFQISRVDDIQLLDDGRVQMIIKIPETYNRWIKTTSDFRLGTLNILSSPVINVSTDLARVSPLVKDGDEFYLTRDTRVTEIVEAALPIVNDLKEIIASANIIIKNFALDDSDFNMLMKAAGVLGQSLQANGDTIISETMLAITNIKNILGNLAPATKGSAEITEELRSTIDNLNILILKLQDTWPLRGNGPVNQSGEVNLQ